MMTTWHCFVALTLKNEGSPVTTANTPTNSPGRAVYRWYYGTKPNTDKLLKIDETALIDEQGIWLKKDCVEHHRCCATDGCSIDGISVLGYPSTSGISAFLWYGVQLRSRFPMLMSGIGYLCTGQVFYPGDVLVVERVVFGLWESLYCLYCKKLWIYFIGSRTIRRFPNLIRLWKVPLDHRWDFSVLLPDSCSQQNTNYNPIDKKSRTFC